MTNFPTLKRVFAALACASALAACSSAPTLPAAPTKLGDMLAMANQAANSGQKEQAVTMWKKTAVAYPADKTPWASIAQTRYDSGQYGEAITAAQEVLLRDPNDKVANSIIAVAGLRLSTRALGDLSRQNNLSGPVRTESQDLAKLLRESLGENVLVPASAPRPRPPVVAGNPKPPVKAGERPKVDKDDDSSANPFSTLK